MGVVASPIKSSRNIYEYNVRHASLMASCKHVKCHVGSGKSLLLLLYALNVISQHRVKKKSML